MSESVNQTYSEAFLGRALDNLSQLIEKQSREVFQTAGIKIPVKSCSTLFAIARLKEASTSDIAQEVNTSHQLIKQKLTTLEKLQMVTAEDDVNDQRRRVFRLTEEGEQQYKNLQTTLPLFEKTYSDLYAEIGVDLLSLCAQFETLLKEKPLRDRIKAT